MLQQSATQASVAGRDTTTTTLQGIPANLSTQPVGNPAPGREAYRTSAGTINNNESNRESENSDDDTEQSSNNDAFTVADAADGAGTTQNEGASDNGDDDETGTPPPPPPPIEIVTEDGADHPSYSLTETDKLLDSVYGDHPHENDGTQLDGGVASNRFWFNHWKTLIQYSRRTNPLLDTHSDGD